MSDILSEEDRKRIYQFLLKFKKENDGNSPTLREISNECGISSTSVVSYHLRAMADHGLITFGPKQMSRSIRIRGGEWSFHQEYTEPVVDKHE